MTTKQLVVRGQTEVVVVVVFAVVLIVNLRTPTDS
jgi:hypothetical protein